MAIQNVTLTSAGSDIFVSPGTVPSDEREYAVTCMMFCNISGADQTVTIHAVPNTAGVGDQNKVISALTIPAGETFTFDTEKIILSTGDKIHAIASANSSIISTVSYMRVS